MKWWGPCPVHDDDKDRYLYDDGLCTKHTRSTAGEAITPPQQTPAVGCGTTPLITGGSRQARLGESE